MTHNERIWLIDRDTGKPSAPPRWWQVALVVVGWLLMTALCGTGVAMVFMLVKEAR